ncbi:hypothetical protein EXVG_00088 [Emiliania huxleyi virus 202]|nr:hypothetical protein EXVG_00088 [Emiliania huxleyi virus 202]AHA54458.1 putative membrane protein [Emiliania huxleyi virus 18]AHA55500.1 putative membrane protein [Emiliania huxleyi virus 156]
MYAPNRAPAGSVSCSPVVDGPVPQEQKPKNSTYFGREFTPAQVDAMKGAMGEIYSFISDNREKPTITRNGIADTPQSSPPPPTNHPPPPVAPVKVFSPAPPLTTVTTTDTTAPVGEKIHPVTAEYIIIMLLVIIIILVYLDYRMRNRVSQMENMIRYMEYGFASPPMYPSMHGMQHNPHMAMRYHPMYI